MISVVMIHVPVQTLALYVLHTILCFSAIGVCARPTIVTYPRSNTAVDTITPPPVRGILMEGRLIRSTPPNKQTSPTKFLVYFLVRHTYLLLKKLFYKINHTIHRDSIRFLVYSIIWSLGCHLTQLLSLHPVLIKAISILPMLKHLKHYTSVPLLLLLCLPGAAALGRHNNGYCIHYHIHLSVSRTVQGRSPRTRHRHLLLPHPHW